MYGMFHHHHWAQHYRRTRSPSRFIWFLIGAGTATFFIKHREAHERDAGWGCTWRHRRELEALRDSVSHHAQAPNVSTGATTSPPPASPSAPATPAPPPAGAPSWPQDRWQWDHQGQGQWMNDKLKAAAEKEWEEKQERIRQIAKQAETKVADISEATLDTILSTVADMKAKLAEHRAQQEQAIKQEQERAEELKRSPPRWV